MKTAVQQTSLFSYREKVVPNLSHLQEKVMEALRELGGATLKEISEHTGIPEKTISGRLTELTGLGILNKRERGITPTRNGGYVRWIV